MLIMATNRLGLALGLFVLASTAAACGPHDGDAPDYVLKSGVGIDGNGKVVVKRQMISREELQVMRDVRAKLGSGELRQADVPGYVRKVYARLGDSNYVLTQPVAEENWAISHWMIRFDGWEIFELMPSGIAGAGDLGQWSYDDGSSLINSRGFETGNFEAEFCTPFHIPCGDIVTSYGRYHRADPSGFSFESYRVLGLRID